jgi:hypothetical protein
MTLILDDGSFEIGNSFVTLDYADDYHEIRATEAWETDSPSDDQKESALIKAFDYLMVQDWSPETFMLDIPDRIKQAQCVGAAKELASPGVLQADKENNIKRKRIEGAIDTEYFSKNLESGTVFTEIQNLIKPYIISKSISTSKQRFLVRM